MYGRVPNGYWDTRENRVRYLNWLGARFGFEEPEDWYRVRFSHFRDNFGRGLISNCYQDSILNALLDLQPDFPWQPWKLACVPQFFWDDVANRRRYMDWLGQQLGYTEPEDWYGLQRASFRQHNGSGLLQKQYSDSILVALVDYKPDYPWLPWKLSCVPKGYWDVADHRRNYMNWLGTQLGYVDVSDWYQLQQEDFRKHDGGGLLHSQYGDSVFAALQEYCAEENWVPWRLVRVPQRFWQSAENRRRYMDWLATQLGFSEPEHWYRLTGDAFAIHHGGGLLQNYYNGSPLQALLEYLPNFDWKPWLFASAPQNVWQDGNTRKLYLQWLGVRLGYQDALQMQQLRSEDLKSHFGASLLNFYRSIAKQDPNTTEDVRLLWKMIEAMEQKLGGGPAENQVSLRKIAAVKTPSTVVGPSPAGLVFERIQEEQHLDE